VGKFTVTEVAAVGQFYAPISPLGGSVLRAHFHLEDPRVKPTNNDSERGFRFAVIQRKVSQCSKTASGAQAFEAFASVIKTAMRQGKDVMERLTGLFRGIDPQSTPT
jgi:hypothetical protein